MGKALVTLLLALIKQTPYCFRNEKGGKLYSQDLFPILSKDLFLLFLGNV